MAEGYISTISRSKIFNDALTQRDTFLGTPRCVVCGADDVQSCYIIAPSFSGDWHMEEFMTREWIPLGVKEPQYELRNGLIMCLNHRALFNRYYFFILFVPKWEKFVLVNYSNNPDLAQYHGKAIGLDIKDSNAPFPTLFIIHEFRVRGHQPFAPIEPEIGDGRWEDWIHASSAFDESSGSFKRERPPNDSEENMTGNPSASGSGSGSSQSQPGLNVNPVTNNQKTVSPGALRAVLDGHAIVEVLLATRDSASWKACETEGTRWTQAGTADENRQRYLASLGEYDS